MGKRISARYIKADLTYTVDEAAQVMRVTPPTIRRWLKDGLPSISDQRPVLIIGSDLREYIKKKQASKRQKLKLGQFWCTSCKAPTEALGGMVDYIPQSANSGRLEALCGCCENLCCRFASTADLPALKGFIELSCKGE